MTKKSWRAELDLTVEQNLKELINECKQYDYAISKSDNKAKAQMWIAMALLNSKINNLMTQRNASEAKIPKEELDEIVRKLEDY